MTKKSTLLAVSALFLASLACQALSKAVPSDSLEARIAEGNIVFRGNGNVNNPSIGCQDPTAVVTLTIGPKTRELDGVVFTTDVNPVTVTAITNGIMVKTEECERVSEDSQRNWPATGIYYADERKIVFTNCTQNNFEASGQAFLEGDGFEGDYGCFDVDGTLIYEVAISAYEVSE